MNYSECYDAIIMRAKTRILTGYFEHHHIVPRSLGGSNDDENIVRLTAREHYICHRLLIRFHHGADKAKMARALQMMMLKGRGQQRYHIAVTSRVYQHLRSEHAKAVRGVPLSPQACANIKASRTPEVRAKISAAQKGRTFPGDKAKLSAAVSAAMTPEHRALLSMRAKERPPISEETRAKMRASHKPMSQAVIDKLTVMNKARVLDEAARAKLSAANKGVKRKLTPEQIAKRTAAQKAARERRSLNDAHDVMLYFSEADLQQLR